MSLSAIRTELKTVMEGVSDIGNVYDYVRQAAHESKIKSLFKTSTDKLLTWFITRVAVHDEWLSHCENGIKTHNFQVLGFYGLKDIDASENTFQDLIDSVMTTLRNASKQPAPLSGTALRMTTPRAEPIDHRQYSKVLTHACRITFAVEEYIPPS